MYEVAYQKAVNSRKMEIIDTELEEENDIDKLAEERKKKTDPRFKDWIP
jgi:hypothetical protein